MSQADWAVLAGSLSGGGVAPRGVTAGPTPPSGGGGFVLGVNLLTNTPGSVGFYATPQAPNTNFNPLVKGGTIRAAMQRSLGGGLTGMAAYAFIGLGGTNVADAAYMLGLSDGDPCHIELRKGILDVGLPDEAVNPTGPNKILRQSTEVVAVGAWVHLRLDMIVNTNGDVILSCFKNTLAVTAPTWVAIPGMGSFNDDALGIATGTLPYTAGRVGVGVRLEDVARRCLFDHLEVAKQI